jgi:glutaredoxin-dependent peroxiredoxin
VESRLTAIRAANGEVIGLSADSPFSLAKWAEQEGYSFTLASDFGKETIRAYGVYNENVRGIKGVPKRSAFLVDKEGRLVQQEIVEEAGKIPDLEGFIARMQTLA